MQFDSSVENRKVVLGCSVVCFAFFNVICLFQCNLFQFLTCAGFTYRAARVTVRRMYLLIVKWVHRHLCSHDSSENIDINPLTHRVKLWAIQSFLTFDSTDRTLHCDHSLERC